VGRTARAELTGVALTFINSKEIRSFQNIEKLIGSEVHKIALPAHIGKGPDYREDKYQRSGRPAGKGNYKNRNKDRKGFGKKRTS
jgi:ATP-dependent RNA helicase RhlE